MALFPTDWGSGKGVAGTSAKLRPPKRAVPKRAGASSLGRADFGWGEAPFGGASFFWGEWGEWWRMGRMVANRSGAYLGPGGVMGE